MHYRELYDVYELEHGKWPNFRTSVHASWLKKKHACICQQIAEETESKSRSVIGLLPSVTLGIWLAAGHGQEQQFKSATLLSRVNKNTV